MFGQPNSLVQSAHEPTPSQVGNLAASGSFQCSQFRFDTLVTK